MEELGGPGTVAPIALVGVLPPSLVVALAKLLEAGVRRERQRKERI